MSLIGGEEDRDGDGHAIIMMVTSVMVTIK